jgi:hypothetical protein
MPEAPMSAAYTENTAAAPFEAAREKFDEMVRTLDSRESMALTHDALERYLIREGCEMQRRMLQGHLDLRAHAERALRVVDAAGIVRVERRRGERALVSLVGEVSVSRLLYQAVGAAGLCPQDASLNLPPESFSFGVRRRVAEEVSSGSFDHAVERIGATTGAAVAKRQVEGMARRAAADFSAFYAQRPTRAEDADALLVLTFDGAGIVVRTEDLRPATRRAAERQAADPRWPPKRLASGQKRNRKRMAQVAAVYAIAPHVREPDDIVRELRPVHDTRTPRPRPRPVNKTVWASVAEEPAAVIDAAFAEALRRDPQRRRRWVVLVDGNETQLELAYAAARKLGVVITVVVDLIHVLEYLWKAAYCFHEDGTREAEHWVTARLRMLLEGADPSDVAGGIRRSATLQGLENRAAVDVCADYLSKYRDQLRYGRAIADGLPIATGVVEGACRYLVRDRMDKTGARWSVAGAEAVLRLRALRSNGDFDAYWQHHMAAEHQRNHLSRYASHVAPNPLPVSVRLRRVK